MDLLVPAIGEIIGGSQREDNLDKLEQRMRELGMNLEDYDFIWIYGSMVLHVMPDLVWDLNEW
mgnify:CR=1 FL=1